MAYYHDREALATFAHEFHNELRDRPMRGHVDDNIREFFASFDIEDWISMREHLSPDAKLIDQLSGPDDIYTNQDSIINWFQGRKLPSQRTSHHLLLIDRGRVTCYVSQFSVQCTRINHSNPQFQEVYKVFIIDLDDTYKIRRIELRAFNNKDSVTHDGDLKAMDAAAREVEKNAIKMDDSI
ncbi:hypothetical protein LY76DRAFT_111272 [Colletotrichum caudatum]|nr:hypothetical protein LY76DRAFT_111272 [Colletotrichum caudatum]